MENKIAQKLEPVADRTLWQWDKIVEAAYLRACLTDASAAAKLRSAIRAIIEAGLAATPTAIDELIGAWK